MIIHSTCQSFLFVSCNSELRQLYCVCFYKIVSTNEKYFHSYETLLAVKWRNDYILSSLAGEMFCYKDNVWNWGDMWAIVLFIWSMQTYTLQTHILPCIILCVWLICYVSIFLIVYCWAQIIFKWFISYDNSFCFV